MVDLFKKNNLYKLEKLNEFDVSFNNLLNPFEDDHPCHIRIQNRKRNRITLIEGLDPKKYALKILLSEMKHRFCTNGNLSPSNIVQLSGDQRHQVKNFLIEKQICRAEQIIIHGLPSTF